LDITDTVANLLNHQCVIGLMTAKIRSYS